jgi:hypothetical protein
MPIPESQLETWSNQGATVAARATHLSIRAALAAGTSPIKDMISSGKIDVYLQGSYKNDTNIRGDSDVDVVVEHSHAFYSNLTEAEKQALGLIPAPYNWQHLRSHVITALEQYYGAQFVDSSGNKSIKVLANSGRLAADVVPCFEDRRYRSLTVAATGMTFWTQRENRQVINYPKLHYTNGCAKNDDSRTGGKYKPVVRMFKNARTYRVDRDVISKDLAPSYFLESFLHNAHDTVFRASLQDTYLGCIRSLASRLISDSNAFFCQNGEVLLFGPLPEQWSVANAGTLLQSLDHLWKNWR